MKQLLQAFNREQWACGIMLAISALMLLMGVAGGGAVQGKIPEEPEEKIYRSPSLRPPEKLNEKFEPYWIGADIFRGEATSKLPVPPINPPVPREEDLVAPLLRPFPSLDAYNRQALAYKYAAFVPSKPLIPVAELPSDADFAALKGIIEVEPPSIPDKRAEREREFDVLYLTGNRQVQEGYLMIGADGKLIITKNGEYMLKQKTGTTYWPVKDVTKFERNWTYEEQYKDKAKQVRAGDYQARLRLAQWCRELGMLPEAKAELLAALEIRNNYAEAIFLLGDILQIEADFEAAFALYNAVLQFVTPDQKCEVQFRIGECFRALGVLEGALEAYGQSAKNTRFVKGRLAHAKLQMHFGQPEKAVETVISILASFSSDATTLTPEVKVQALLLRATAQIRMGNILPAKTDLTEALKINDKHAEALVAMGVVLVLEGQYKTGAASFVAAIQQDQYLIEAWTNLGAVYFVAGKMAEADALFAAAVQRDPSSADALAGQAAVLIVAGKDAAPLLMRALDVDPGHSYVRYLLGILKLRAGALDESVDHFGRSLQSEFYFLPAYYGAGTAFLQSAKKLTDDAAAEIDEPKAEDMRRKADQYRINAETLFKTIHEFDRSRINAFIALGCVYLVMERPGEARQKLVEAKQMVGAANLPADPLIEYALGYLEYRFGSGASSKDRLEAAQGIFRRMGSFALDKYPDPSSQWAIKEAAKMVDDIKNWLLTSIRLDDRFDREPDPKHKEVVGNGWIEGDRKYNVHITLEKGRCKISGSPNEEWGITTLEREIPPDDFYRLEATFIPVPKEGEKPTFEFGLSLYFYQQMGLHLGVDTNGKVRMAQLNERDMNLKDMSIGWDEIKLPFPLPPEVTFRIEKRIKDAGTFIDVSAFDPAKKDFVKIRENIAIYSPSGQGKNYKVSFFSRGWKGKDYTLYLDNVRIYDRKRS